MGALDQYMRSYQWAKDRKGAPPVDEHKPEVVYMAVTMDKYRLPTALASSAYELARICGVTQSAVYKSIRLWQQGKPQRFIKVLLDEEDG